MTQKLENKLISMSKELLKQLDCDCIFCYQDQTMLGTGQDLMELYKYKLNRALERFSKNRNNVNRSVLETTYDLIDKTRSLHVTPAGKGFGFLDIETDWKRDSTGGAS